MHDDREIIEQRLARVRKQVIRPHRWGARVPFDMEMWEVPDAADGFVGEPVAVGDALAATYVPCEPGTAWGKPWSTTWFRLRGTVPDGWAGQPVEAILDLGFGNIGPGFVSEGMVWAPAEDGAYVPERGLHPARASGRRLQVVSKESAVRDRSCDQERCRCGPICVQA